MLEQARLLGWVILVLVAICRPSVAQTPPGLGPYLQIETGEHIQAVNALAMLPGAAELVSVADDNTARFWSTSSLDPQAVLRPPMGPNDEGKLYAVATATNLLAVGGVIPDGTGAFAVHLYSLSPRLRWAGRFPGLPAVRVLRFSQDGQFLAIGLMGGGGLLVYNMLPFAQKPRRPPLLVLADLPNDAAIAVPPAIRIDSRYSGDVTGLAFDRNDRLAVVADGRLRLYRTLTINHPPVLGPKSLDVRSVAFSPDGARLAATDLSQDVVHLLDADSLRQIAPLRGRPGYRGIFFDSAFSPDGQSVFAAGSYKDPTGTYLVRSWSANGRPIADSAAARNTILALLPVDHGVVYGSADPAVGLLDASGQRIAFQRSPLIDFRDAGLTVFRISPDASTVEMPGPRLGKHLRFDVHQRSVEEVSESDPTLLTPQDRGPGLVVSNWRNSHTPMLNGHVIMLESKEIARAVAVSPTGNGVALGTDFYLRFETARGESWRIPTEAAVWAVDVSADGSMIVAALADGTVRWFDTEKHLTFDAATNLAQLHQERLGLLIDPGASDTQAPRWILWTPLGFFDHDHRTDGTPDGRGLIGYLVNAKDWSKAKFLQIGQIYGIFFRPDLVDLAFRGQTLNPAQPGTQVPSADILTRIISGPVPPRLTLLDACGHDPRNYASGCPTESPDDVKQGTSPLVTTAEDAVVVYRIDAQGTSQGSVIIRRNGAVIRPDIFVDEETIKSRSEEATIPLGAGLNDIQVIPVNKDGTVQGTGREILRLQVMRRIEGRGLGPVAALSAPQATPDATLYMLSIGISQYARPQLQLANAAHDAQAMSALMSTPAPPIYLRPVVTTLIDAQATSANIVAALSKIAAQAQPDDLVVIFIAGHGQQVNGRYYFAPVEFGMHDAALFSRAMDEGDATSDHAIDTLFATEGLGQDQLLPLIQSIKAAHVALILDTCYSAAIATEDIILRRDMNDTVVNQIGNSTGRFVLSSSLNLALDTDDAGPTDLPVDDQGHGLFTAYVLQALSGKADFMHRGQVDIDDLAKFTQLKVEEATKALQEPQQPAYYFNGNDFFPLRTSP